ncbi:M56 family metallopeptidase [Streptosporangium pseudovulgare]|uniref:Peptidase M48 n=1 Tax=Streptosporangium pseudovulgare TaxID=35765 RepID=A0ABQ2RC03_9ACTN|nr:M56 family metallopeptidase [Streptosporangium pseudovulgare]GGQ19069.1 peptidase M48 [Streptosporangium pseudovulgare]
MFDHFVWSVLTVPVVMVALIALLADRLPPSPAAKILAWSAAGAALASLLNVVAFTVKAVAEIPVVADCFEWSYQTVIDDTRQVRWVPWLSSILMVSAAVAVRNVVARYRRGRAWALRFGEAESHDRIVVVPSEEIEAFAVPGRPGHVVVTTGMRKILTDDQYGALVAHERAHLEHDHFKLMLLSDLAGAVHPALRWVSDRVGYLVERAADEHAAETVGDRRILAQAIGTAALAAGGRPPLRLGPLASFARPGRAGVIPRRVAALLRQAHGGRLWPAALPAALAVSSLIWTGEAWYDLAELLVLAARH